VADLLGFDAPEDNTLDAIANRWEAEAHVAHAWAVTLTHLSALAQDIIWLSTPPREWVRLDDAHVTGSSIMPQKRNPDLAEVTRARATACQASARAIVATATGQLSGYNRDLQWTKYHIMDAWWQFARVPEAWGHVLEGLTLNRRAMREACEIGFMEAAEVADYLAIQTGQPFRKLHGVLAAAVEASEPAQQIQLGALNGQLAAAKIKYQMSEGEWQALSDPAARIAQRTHSGSPAPDRVKETAAELLGDLRAAREAHRRWQRDLIAARRRLDRLVAKAV
jgi:argininosuccinate lyase